MARRYGRGYGYDRYESRFPVQPTVGEVAARAAQASKKLGAKQELQPVFAEGRKLATTWWGQSWDANLERYADFTNRLPRGRTYLRYGAVLDLRLAPGQITGLVQGSMSKPYEITISIAPLKPAIWDLLRQQALGQLDSLTDLLTGRFPEGLKSLFFAQGQGLFPEPGELKLDCSCPDWSDCCKHVAAVLYGVGVRLDTQPDLLFAMRQVSTEELIKQTVTATAAALVRKGDAAASDDVLADSDVAGVFGITMDDAPPAPNAPKPAPAAPPPAPAPKTPAKGKGNKAKASAPKAAPAPPAPDPIPFADPRAAGRAVKAAMLAKLQREIEDMNRRSEKAAKAPPPVPPKASAGKRGQVGKSAAARAAHEEALAAIESERIRSAIAKAQAEADRAEAARARQRPTSAPKVAAAKASAKANAGPAAKAAKPQAKVKAKAATPPPPAPKVYSPGKPVKGAMLDQLCATLQDCRTPFTVDQAAARFPEWTRLQVYSTLLRAAQQGLLRQPKPQHYQWP